LRAPRELARELARELDCVGNLVPTFPYPTLGSELGSDLGPALGPAAVRKSLRELADLTGSETEAGANLSIAIRGAAALDEADWGEITFLEDPQLVARLESTRATACFVASRHRRHVPPTCVALVTEVPTRAFGLALAALFPHAARPTSTFGTAGANPGAIIHPEARLEPGVVVDPGVVIGPRAEIGGASVIGAGSIIGPDVRIGRECAIGALVTIGHALVGNRVVLQPGARIGQDGFCFAAAGERLVKVPHIGRVILQDDVEIGANTTIDRGVTGDTVVGEGTKVASQVQIAAGVTIGRHCAIGAQAGLAREARLGDAAVIGAKARLDPWAVVAAGGRVGDGVAVPWRDA
jgi:UDP-3-O-[3-hydroxymyristoyl] glucosamine N-acyltransferase